MKGFLRGTTVALMTVALILTFTGSNPHIHLALLWFALLADSFYHSMEKH